MTDTLGLRLDELIEAAAKAGVGDDIDAPELRIAVGAYADVLGLDVLLVFDLSLTLDEIRLLS